MMYILSIKLLLLLESSAILVVGKDYPHKRGDMHGPLVLSCTTNNFMLTTWCLAVPSAHANRLATQILQCCPPVFATSARPLGIACHYQECAAPANYQLQPHELCSSTTAEAPLCSSLHKRRACSVASRAQTRRRCKTPMHSTPTRTLVRPDITQVSLASTSNSHTCANIFYAFSDHITSKTHCS